MDRSEQLKEWLDGNSIHDEEDNICVPDYSCCYPNMTTNTHNKQMFAKAWIEGDEDALAEMVEDFTAKLLGTVIETE